MVDLLRPQPPPSARQRVADLLDRLPIPPAVALGACLACVALVVGALVVLRHPAPPPLRLPSAAPAAPAASAPAPAATAAPAELVVHAAGAVVHPGVYRLHAGARVDDVVAAAGGPAPDADVDQIDLAAPVADGDRVYVPRRGEVPPPVVGASGVSGAAGAPLDLNRATAAELDALPGVGPSTAQAIVDYRRTHGRFRSVDELGHVRGIGPARLATLRPLVRVT